MKDKEMGGKEKEDALKRSIVRRFRAFSSRTVDTCTRAFMLVNARACIERSGIYDGSRYRDNARVVRLRVRPRGRP